MKTGDRLLRAAFVSLAVGLAWSVRGDYGKVLGAMFPGAALGLGFAYVSGQRAMFKWMPLFGALGGLVISLGGEMSYGLLHAYASNTTFPNYSYGFFTLILQGGAWGCFGCCVLGLLLEKEPLKAWEWAVAIGATVASGLVFWFLVVRLIGFNINPGKSNTSVAYTGGVIGLFVWLVSAKKRYGFKGALFGYIGFGLGMAGGRFLANVRDYSTWKIGDWLVLQGLFSRFGNIMELIVGLIGGFIFTYGMLGKKAPDFPEDKIHYKLLSVGSIFYVMAGIPILHRLLRATSPPVTGDDRMPRWTELLQRYGYADPVGLAHKIPTLVTMVCVIGIVAAVLWLLWHFRNKYGFAAFPVLALTALMIVIQNIDNQYLFYPFRQAPGKMLIFPGIFVLMLLYVIFGKRPEVTEPDEVAEHVNWRRWVVGAVVAYLLIVVLSGPVNAGRSDKVPVENMRFPVQARIEPEPTMWPSAR